MTFETKLSNEKLFKFILEYAVKYKGFTPGVALMQMIHKVTSRCIHNKLNNLEKEGKIEKLKKEVYNVAYVVNQDILDEAIRKQDEK